MTIVSVIRDLKSVIPRLVLKRVATAVLLGGIASIVSTSSFAQSPTAASTHEHAPMMGSHGEQDIVAHVNGMLQLIYTQVGATDAQKAKLAGIVQQATDDLAPLQEKLHVSHANLFGLLTQPNIDLNAVEAERAAHLTAADQTLKRSTKLVIDVAEALTPEQRKALADHMSQHTS